MSACPCRQCIGMKLEYILHELLRIWVNKQLYLNIFKCGMILVITQYGIVLTIYYSIWVLYIYNIIFKKCGNIWQYVAIILSTDAWWCMGCSSGSSSSLRNPMPGPRLPTPTWKHRNKITQPVPCGFDPWGTPLDFHMQKRPPWLEPRWPSDEFRVFP